MFKTEQKEFHQNGSVVHHRVLGKWFLLFKSDFFVCPNWAFCLSLGFYFCFGAHCNSCSKVSLAPSPISH